MKTLNFFTKGALLALTATVLLISCKKDKEEDDTDTSTSRDNAFAESSYNDVVNMADEAEQSGSVGSYKMGADEASLLLNCAAVTFNKLNNIDQDTIIIDFGSTNCTGNDGRQRRGKVIVYYSGRFKTVGSTHTITFDNYYVNNNKVDGSRTVKNDGFNSAGHLTWQVYGNGTIILANGNGTVTWGSTRKRELLGVLGSSMLNSADTTIVWSQSKWGITGTASGISATGVIYSTSITKQLVFDHTCITNRRHPTQGSFDFTPSGKATRTVDFGNGTCDDQATVTIKGKTYTITLK